jgi:hypothetical protein
MMGEHCHGEVESADMLCSKEIAGLKMLYFCSYFDSNYLPRALALYQSLVTHCDGFRFFVLCLDREVRKQLQDASLENVCAITLDQLEAFEPALLTVKDSRTPAEYYFTCGPSFIRYTLMNCPGGTVLTYLDADLYFFASPRPLLEILGSDSIGIIENRYPRRHPDWLRFGKYNVGWISFRRDERAEACLAWWSRQCIQWCFDRTENGRYADQKYLDEWPERFPGVRILNHKGANVAPWNRANYCFSKHENTLYVDDAPLVFFHFQGLKEIRPWLVDSNLGCSFRFPDRVLRRDVFGAYLRELRRVCPDGPRTMSRRKEGNHSIRKLLKRRASAFLGAFTGAYLFRIRDKIL